jgi:hypothetical protein
MSLFRLIIRLPNRKKSNRRLRNRNRPKSKFLETKITTNSGISWNPGTGTNPRVRQKHHGSRKSRAIVEHARNRVVPTGSAANGANLLDAAMAPLAVKNVDLKVRNGLVDANQNPCRKHKTLARKKFVASVRRVLSTHREPDGRKQIDLLPIGHKLTDHNRIDQRQNEDPIEIERVIIVPNLSLTNSEQGSTRERRHLVHDKHLPLENVKNRNHREAHRHRDDPRRLTNLKVICLSKTSTKKQSKRKPSNQKAVRLRNVSQNQKTVRLNLVDDVDVAGFVDVGERRSNLRLPRTKISKIQTRLQSKRPTTNPLKSIPSAKS